MRGDFSRMRIDARFIALLFFAIAAGPALAQPSGEQQAPASRQERLTSADSYMPLPTLSAGVLQRYATTSGDSNKAIFVQLELNDFAKIGSNPLEMLSRKIPGYGLINKSASDPVFGYD